MRSSIERDLIVLAMVSLIYVALSLILAEINVSNCLTADPGPRLADTVLIEGCPASSSSDLVSSVDTP